MIALLIFDWFGTTADTSFSQKSSLTTTFTHAINLLEVFSQTSLSVAFALHAHRRWTFNTSLCGFHKFYAGLC